MILIIEAESMSQIKYFACFLQGRVLSGFPKAVKRIHRQDVSFPYVSCIGFAYTEKSAKKTNKIKLSNGDI